MCLSNVNSFFGWFIRPKRNSRWNFPIVVNDHHLHTHLKCSAIARRPSWHHPYPAATLRNEESISVRKDVALSTIYDSKQKGQEEMTQTPKNEEQEMAIDENGDGDSIRMCVSEWGRGRRKSPTHPAFSDSKWNARTMHMQYTKHICYRFMPIYY